MVWNNIRTFISAPDGGVMVNAAKQYVQPFYLVPDAPNQKITIAGNGYKGPYPITAAFDGPVEIFGILAHVKDENGDTLTDYNVRILLEHPGKNVRFMPQAVPLINIAGDAGRPYVLPETIFLPAVSSLNVTLLNDDAAQRTVDLVFIGIKFYWNAAPQEIGDDINVYTERRERTYTYFMPLDEDGAITLTGSQTGQKDYMTIPDDADMEIFKLTCECTGQFEAKLRDTANDRGIIPEFIHSSLIFGAHHADAAGAGVGGSGGIFPAKWPTTFLARRSTKLEWEFNELSGSSNTLRPVLAGRKVRYDIFS